MKILIADERKGRVYNLQVLIDQADIVIEIQQDGIFVTKDDHLPTGESAVRIEVGKGESVDSAAKAEAQKAEREARRPESVPSRSHIDMMKDSISGDVSHQRTFGDREDPDATKPRDPWT